MTTTYTDKVRAMSHGERAYQAGYDWRYEHGSESIADCVKLWYWPAGALARAWCDGWHKADEELK